MFAFWLVFCFGSASSVGPWLGWARIREVLGTRSVAYGTLTEREVLEREVQRADEEDERPSALRVRRGVAWRGGVALVARRSDGTA